MGVSWNGGTPKNMGFVGETHHFRKPPLDIITNTKQRIKAIDGKV